jgi:hypothetical protein
MNVEVKKQKTIQITCAATRQNTRGKQDIFPSCFCRSTLSFMTLFIEVSYPGQDSKVEEVEHENKEKAVSSHKR